MGHNLAYPPNRSVLQRNYNLLRQAAKSHCEIHVIAFESTPLSRPSGVTAYDCVRALREFSTEVHWLEMGEGLFGSNRYWLAFRGLISPDPYEVHWMRTSKMAKLLTATLQRLILMWCISIR